MHGACFPWKQKNVRQTAAKLTFFWFLWKSAPKNTKNPWKPLTDQPMAELGNWASDVPLVLVKDNVVELLLLVLLLLVADTEVLEIEMLVDELLVEVLLLVIVWVLVVEVELVVVLVVLVAVTVELVDVVSDAVVDVELKVVLLVAVAVELVDVVCVAVVDVEVELVLLVLLDVELVVPWERVDGLRGSGLFFNSPCKPSKMLEVYGCFFTSLHHLKNTKNPPKNLHL